VRKIHLKLGEQFDWKKINANLTVEEIHAQLWNEVIKIIGLSEADIKPINRQSTINNLKLFVERLSPFAKLLTRAHASDAGLDLYAGDNYTLFPGDITGIKTGLKIKIPNGCVGLIWDKSGLAKIGLHTLAGVVDSGYRGEIIVLIKNLSEDIFNISVGQKIAQIIIQKIETPKIIENEIDDETERGYNGFGSTGKF
jgi:dUTP pyrophosphatase